MKKTAKPVRPLSLASHQLRPLVAEQIELVAAARGGATNVPTGGCGNYPCD